MLLTSFTSYIALAILWSKYKAPTIQSILSLIGSFEIKLTSNVVVSTTDVSGLYSAAIYGIPSKGPDAWISPKLCLSLSRLTYISSSCELVRIFKSAKPSSTFNIAAIISEDNW